MRAVQKWILALLAVALWTAPARPAEKQELIPQRGAIRLMLLRHKAVQEELKLTDEQTMKIHDFTSKQWQRAKKLADQEGDDRLKEFEEMAKENNHFLHETLKPEQWKRLNQIALQRTGLAWVTQPEVVSELKLTDQQKQKAEDLQKEAHKEWSAFFHSDKTESAAEEAHALRKKDRERLMSLLTEEQKEKYKELCGEPFKGHLDDNPSK